MGIIYHLELPEGEIFVSTNELYLSLVIENLLDNANKFTDSVEIRRCFLLSYDRLFIT